MKRFRWQDYWDEAESWYRVRAFYTASEKLFPDEKSMTLKFIKVFNTEAVWYEGEPWQSYIADCPKCEYLITESDWEPANVS